MRATAADPDWERRVRHEFDGQAFMHTLRADLVAVGPGRVSIGCRHGAALTQQHGFVHAGVLATLADTASGFAALSLMPADRDVLTADFTVHLLRPATSGRFTAAAEVIRAGRTLTVCSAQVTGDTLWAVATVTLAAVRRRDADVEPAP